MSLRILFADDSVTAQNMGKKILTEAGYEVVAVSNGAAAVKKIAEQKPDIIILDVYMPGYSGLEVCEKVRGSMDTLKTPVLLTVGKMEPYKPEDANRVKADGVIVKPFEASDLLAIVKKFEERISQTPVAAPVFAQRFQAEEVSAETTTELPVEPVASATPQPTLEVPDHMATSSAFSDLLGMEPSVSGNHFEPPPPAVREAPAVPVPHTTIPEYELPVSWREREDLAPEPPTATVAEPAPVQPATEPELEPVIPPPAPAASRPRQIPVYEEREPAPGAWEVVPTSAPPLGDIEIPREPELEESVADATRNTVAETIDPGLLPTHQQFEPMPASAAELAPVEEQFPPAGFQDIPADIVSHLPPPAAEPAPAAPQEKPSADSLTDNDFEARVAAAMSAYSHAQEAPQSQPAVREVVPAATDFAQPRAVTPGPPHEAAEPHAQGSPAMEAPAPPMEYYPAAREVPEPEVHAGDVMPAAPAAAVTEEEPIREPIHATEPTAPVFEYRPPVHAAPEEPASEAGDVPATARPEPEPMSAVEPPAAPPSKLSEAEAVAAGIEAKLPEVAAAGAAAGADQHTIAQAVHRVMERLKPELVEEILRELKSNKE